MTNTNNSRPRKSAAPIVVLTVAAVVGAVWVARQTMQFLADYRTQHTLHGVIDKSHPAIQGPFTILDVQPINATVDYSYPKAATDAKKLNSVREADTGIWVNVNLPQGTFLEAPSYPGDKPTFTASVTLRDGSVIPIGWKRVNGASNGLALVDIPAGYPPNTRWMDLTLKMATGENAHWRISPVATTEPISRVTSVRPPLAPHIHLTGSVTPETEGGWQKGTPRCELKITGDDHQLDVTTTGIQFENEPANYARTNVWSGGMSVIYDGHEARYQTHQVAPFWRYSHNAVINADMVEYENFTEHVVFRHVALKRVDGKYMVAPDKAMTLRTPIGFAVTLLDGAHQHVTHREGEQTADSHHTKAAVFYAVRIARPDDGGVKSPLVRRYHLPVVSWSTSTGDPLNSVSSSSMMSTGQDDPLAYYNRFFPPLPVPAFIDIPVDVTHRVNLSSHFASVAVPVVTSSAKQ